jgi:hypothetical protein
MAEIDPIILVAAGTVVVGIVTFVSCMKSSEPAKADVAKVADAAVKSPVVAASKPKKKSKPAKKTTGTSAAVKVVDSKEPVKETPKATPVVAVPESRVDNDADAEADKIDDTEDMFVMSEAMKKAKKAKETQEQKEARVERQRAAKALEKKVADAEAAAAAARFAEAANAQISAAAPSSFDGWAVVEGSRKAKGKKSDASDEESPGPVSSSADPAPGQRKSTASASPAPTPVEEPAAPSVPVDLVTTLVNADARKLGLLIGPKGVTKIGLQTATGTEIVMPKVEKDHTGSVEISVTGPAVGVARAVHALNELCTKGYCNLLAGADFHEGYVEVKPKYVFIEALSSFLLYLVCDFLNCVSCCLL